MIIKSLSRKSPSFHQLVEYMQTGRDDTRFDLFHHCWSREKNALSQEFSKNSQLLRKRKNGNYLYHEIVSITLAQGVDPAYAKKCLREIVLKYIQDRCGNNMVYGCLHEDHSDHIHYHLVISANPRGETRRLRLPKAEYETIKRDLEEHVLEKYPELKQERGITADRETKRISRKASEVKRRNGKLDRQDTARSLVREAMEMTQDMGAFRGFLQTKNARYYTRGKHHGLEIQHPDGKQEKYRFATLGIDAEFSAYHEGLETRERKEAFETASKQAENGRTHDASRGNDPNPQGKHKQPSEVGKTQEGDAQTIPETEYERQGHIPADEKGKNRMQEKQQEPQTEKQQPSPEQSQEEAFPELAPIQQVWKAIADSQKTEEKTQEQKQERDPDTHQERE